MNDHAFAWQIGGHSSAYHTCQLDRALRGIRRAGFSFVELAGIPGWVQHVKFDAEQPVHQLLARYELQAVSVSAHSDLTTEDGVTFLLRAIEWASRNDVPIINTAVGGHSGSEESIETFLAFVPAIDRAARRAGVVVGLETHGGIMASAVESVRLLARIGSPRIRLTYDTGNVAYFAGVRAVDDLPIALDYLACVHLKDHVGPKGQWNFPALGDGDVDIAGVLRLLREAAFAGPCSVELDFGGAPWPPAPVVDYSMRRSARFLAAQGVAVRGAARLRRPEV